jgi:hypothetical protein
MSDKLPTIKITETKIVINRFGILETFSTKEGNELNYISYQGRIYKFVSEKAI